MENFTWIEWVVVSLAGCMILTVVYTMVRFLYIEIRSLYINNVEYIVNGKLGERNYLKYETFRLYHEVMTEKIENLEKIVLQHVYKSAEDKKKEKR